MKKLKRELMPARIKRAKKELTELSHTFVRKRDSRNAEILGGYCIDCGKYTEGRDYQCGHWIPDSVGGATLRYHPLNMWGQASSCNCGYNQEMVKINYTRAITQKLGEKRVARLIGLKNKVIKADIIWYEAMISLYKNGDQDAIVHFLEKVLNY